MNKDELIELKKICNDLDYKVLSLIFDADDNILHQRFIKRLDENRHYVHKSQDFTKIEDFIPVINDLRNAPYFGQIITVKCNDFSYQTDEMLLNQIEEFINE